MKSFYDLTDKEILSLTDEAIEWYCDIELMKNGVIKPIAPIRPKDPESMNIRTETWYGVDVNYHTTIFRTMEQAQAFAELEPHELEKVYEFDNPQVYRAKISNETTIKPVKISNSDDIIKYKTQASIYKSQKKEYDNLFKKYNEECSSFQEITEGVFNKRREIENENRQINKIIETYNGYLVLADNDKTIAFNFLKKAYEVDKIKEAFEWSDNILEFTKYCEIADNIDE